MPKFTAYDIQYDTDGEQVELPDSLVIEADDYNDACLNGADQISDQTGWCVEGFRVR